MISLFARGWLLRLRSAAPVAFQFRFQFPDSLLGGYAGFPLVAEPGNVASGSRVIPTQ